MTIDDRILAVMSEDDPMSTEAIARRIDERQGRVSKRLRSMDARGMVERTQHGTADRPAMWRRIGGCEE